MDEREELKVTDIIEEVKSDICISYCKWPNIWDEEKEGMELIESDICRRCPLNRL
jgi:Pyruvate/2-oxoacid:ferredoxin oxidoreductase delta subunit